MLIIRRVTAALAAAVLASTVAVVAAGMPAQADSTTTFYTPPTSLPAVNGTVIRSEPSTFYVDPLHVLRAPATVNRIMFRTTDRVGRPIAVTGTVLTPRTPWIGAGPRPVVGMAAGTQGLADDCAPSRQLAAGTEYEGIFLSGLLARGYGVVMPDYQGLGTPGEHTYLIRDAQGHALLDSIRAAQRLPQAGLPADGPVGIYGFSQGGMAAAAAAELAPSYSPELKIKGVVAGAVPADLAATAHQIDGSLYSAFLLYALSGISTEYGIDLSTVLNKHGLDLVQQARQTCTIPGVLSFPFLHSTSITKTGETVDGVLSREPWRSAIAAQSLGYRAPAVPVLVTQSLFDDVVPYQVGKDLAKHWCSRGADVRLSTNVGPTHIGDAIASFPAGFAFLEARFAGLPATSNCRSL